MGFSNCMGPGCTFREELKIGEDGVASAQRLMKCSQCKKLAYCSKECQTKHWPQHKNICKQLRDNSNVMQLDNLHEVYKQLDGPLYGRHAPASERIIWHSMGDKDAKTQRTNAFMKKLDIEHVGQYAVEKFIGSGRGAVAFNMNFPVPQVKGYGQFVWAPLAGLIKSEDDLLINTVSKYDPKREFVILYLLPAEDGLTVDIWMMTLFCTFPPHIVSLVRSAAVEHEQAWKEWRGEN